MHDDLPILTRAQVRELDRVTIETYGIPGVVLMENAGRGAAERLLARLEGSERVLIVCGAGNNGGDGYVVARHLAEAGLAVLIAETATPDALSPDAAVYRGACRSLGLTLVHAPDGAALRAQLESAAAHEIVVDALLGTGYSGATLREPAASILTELGEAVQRWSSTVVALDAPSGFDVDTGDAAPESLPARLTLTFAALKPALAEPENEPRVGRVLVVPIGAPRAAYERI